MFKRFQHTIVLMMLLFITSRGFTQIAMPDTVCVGTARTYRVNDASVPSTYTWKIDGIIQTSTSNQMNVTWNSPGVFTVSVQEHSLAGCDGDLRTGLVYVNSPPVANAGPDVTVCFGAIAQLNGSGGSVYQWSPTTYLSNPRVANPVAAIPAAGSYKYFLAVTSNGCSSFATDTVVITVLQQAKVFAGNDTVIAVGQPLQLDATDQNAVGFTNYIWSPATGLNNSFIKNPIATISQPQTAKYIVTAKTIEGCQATDDIIVKVFTRSEIWVPNAFSPNNDGLNDVLRPTLSGIKELKYFSVYNRYGQLVYTTSTPGAGWNGTFNGVMQNTGVFVWIAEAVDYSGNILSRRGTAVLIK